MITSRCIRQNVESRFLRVLDKTNTYNILVGVIGSKVLSPNLDTFFESMSNVHIPIVNTNRMTRRRAWSNDVLHDQNLPSAIYRHGK